MKKNVTGLIALIALAIALPVKSSWSQSLIDSGDWSDDHLLRGLLSPKVETALSSRMAGRIDKIAVSEGDRFKKGDLLVEFDCSIQLAQLEKAQAELKAARKTLDVNRELAHLKSISGLDVAMAEASLLKAQAELVVQKTTVDMCKIHAPFSGRVADVQVNEFQTVAHAEPLLEILDDRTFEVEVIVPSAWLSFLKVGMPFTIAMDETGRSYTAEVTQFGARIDPVSQSLKVVGQVKKPDSYLVSGMSGRVAFSRQDQ